jgi:Fe(3+) dicitrate transport protein
MGPKFLLALILMAWMFAGTGAAQQVEQGAVRGRVVDTAGGIVRGARVVLALKSSGAERSTTTNEQGEFSLDDVARGEYELRVEARGFVVLRKDVEHKGGLTEIALEVTPAGLVQEVVVTAGELFPGPEVLERHPGSAQQISASELRECRVFTTDEALRKVPGVNTRGEEGLGLRPNIGVRGLNPTRSSQVLLLEDGLPLAYAPYGDNASYYHPPVDRFESVEVVKGGGQILYGPRTVGAVVNYVTPPPPERASGWLTLAGGNRDYLDAHVRYGGTIRNTGLLVDLLRKQGRGARENLRHGVNDLNLKSLTTLGKRQTLSLRFNSYSEDSQVTYSGLRQSEFEANPRANPFRNDSFESERYGISARHGLALSDALVISTSAYATFFHRDWWRQSSNSNQRPNDASDPACGGMQNLNTSCGNEGRLRRYRTWGVESKARGSYRWLGTRHEADFGVRLHFETQERRQENGDTPWARAGRLVEDNRREARAFSFFVQDGMVAGKWKFTPGLRVEKIHYERLNRLGNSGAGVSGKSELVQVLPGIGTSYSAGGGFSFFAGVHRGFAPPRVEDVISNTTGASLELGPELSWNWEAGVRMEPTRALRVEATFFRMDFENQIVPASVAGGVGATLTNAGKTLHQGMELGWQVQWVNPFGSRHRLYWRGAYTWLPVARYEGERYSNVPGFTNVLITGNRLPYAPRNLLTTSVGFVHNRGMNAMLEAVYTGRQFGDDLNTIAGTPDGQRGVLPGNALWNATVNYPVEPLRVTVFVSVKNLFNRTVIVDRTRGILPGIPRLVHAGVHWNF